MQQSWKEGAILCVKKKKRDEFCKNRMTNVRDKSLIRI